MTTATTKAVQKPWDGAILLLKEFTAKLLQAATEVDAIAERLQKNRSQNHTESNEWLISRLQSRQQGIQRLLPSVDDLDRHVSQLIEHGALPSELDRVELKLRLAELESAMEQAHDAAMLSPQAILK